MKEVAVKQVFKNFPADDYYVRTDKKRL